MKNTLIFLFFFFFDAALCLSPDGLALLSLKSAVDGGATVLADWNESDATPCRWSGVSCAAVAGVPDPRVTGISLPGRNLRGYVPSELGTLAFLRRLNLHDNAFHGSIPAQLFHASSLRTIFLYNNNLSGSLPKSICDDLESLQTLDLSRNSLSGPIPKGLNKCRRLRRLVIDGNRFSGEIPAGIWPEMKGLVQLDISSNTFSGSIPGDMGELGSLAGTLNISHNNFSGEIPESLGKLPVAVSFDLRHNDLSGEIPKTGSFASQGPTAFLDNPRLCGFPLRKTCRSSGENLPGAPGSPESGENLGKRPSPGMIVLISIADAAAVALVGLFIVYVYWKRKDSDDCSCTLKAKLGGVAGAGAESRLCSCLCIGGSNKNGSELDESSDKGEEGHLVAIDKGFRFELDELLRASAYVLGKGGLGIVYKVVLASGAPVAVRRLGEGGERRYKEFSAEMEAIGRVKHPNVVRLRAYYWAAHEKLLVSDFISNGNLASALRGKNGQPSSALSWSTRLKIARGAARGLAYLHEYSPRKHVHGAIKPSNILLDADLSPHISDFGLARLVAIAGTDPSSSGGFIGGALPYLKSSKPDRSDGYRAPEASGGPAQQKCDVYSFGVVLMELLTGRSPEAVMTSAGVCDVARWVREGLDQGEVWGMVDPTVVREARGEKEAVVVGLFRVAVASTELDPEARPRMKSVSDSLEKIRS